MNTMRPIIIILAGLLVCSVPGLSQWELGVIGGGGFRRDLSVANDTHEGTLSFRPGAVLGGYGGLTEHGYLGGEAHYLFEQGTMRLQSSSGEATMSGRAHVAHFDLLIHAAPGEARVRPFLAIGGGVKVYEGLGPDRAVQPGSDLIMLTRTREVLGAFTPAVGAKFRLARHVMLRTELRYILTPSPNKVVTPAPGSVLKGWVHEFVPTIGIAATF